MVATVAETKVPVDLEANCMAVVGQLEKPELKQSSKSSSTVSTMASVEDLKALDVPLARVKLFRLGGTLPSAICLCKAAIGAGILSMAAHCADVGFVYQLVAMLVGALLSLVSISMIADASISTKCWSCEEICEDLFHPAMSFATGLINVCNCLGAAAAYLIVCGQVFQVLSGADEVARKLFVVAMGVLVCAPMALAEHLGFMRHLAALSVGALLLLVVAVIWFFGEHGPDESVTPRNFFAGSGMATVFTYMTAVNNIIFAYNNQFNVPKLTGELKPVPSIKKMSHVSLMSTGICFLLYAGVSVFGVLAFGIGENQKDSLLLDLYPERGNPLVFMSLAAVMFSVLTCFQFHVYPIRGFAAFAIRKIRGRGAKDESTDAVYYGKSLTRWLDIASALAAVSVIILIAVVITSLRTIINFIGAFASAYTCYIVPPLWIIQVRRRQEGFTWGSRVVLGCLAFFSLGVFLFVFGTYAAIREAASN